jgi:hypothetical protein
MGQFRSRPAFAACIARGMTWTAAARAVGVTRQAAYLWMQSDPEFVALIEDAHQQRVDYTESKLFKLIEADYFPAIAFALTHWKPEVYGKKRIAVGGDNDAPPIRTEHTAWIYPRPELTRAIEAPEVDPGVIDGKLANGEEPTEETEEDTWARLLSDLAA